jgi:hypothetical protein
MKRVRPWLWLGGVVVLAAGALLWRAFGLQVWLDQAIAFCL